MISAPARCGLKFLQKSEGKRKKSEGFGEKRRTFAESLCAFSRLSLHFHHSGNRYFGVQAGIMLRPLKADPFFSDRPYSVKWSNPYLLERTKAQGLGSIKHIYYHLFYIYKVEYA
jgi:hypothetical protein